MEFKIWKTRALLVFLLSAAFTICYFVFWKQPLPVETTILPSVPIAINQVTTQVQPTQNQENQSSLDENLPISSTANLTQSYSPKYEIAWAHPLNYGERYTKDIYGRPVYNQPIIVLHETVNSAASAINHFQTPHQNEDNQASYHTLIKLDGTVVYIVPPGKRAFGAGNSVFKGSNGLEAVKTDPNLPPSVNNFAYHVSLETPSDGRNAKRRHSGYTNAQYQSLAWLIAQSRVPDSRITTHKIVDRSGTRIDPRSFNRRKFLSLLHSYRGQRKEQISANNSNY